MMTKSEYADSKKRQQAFMKALRQYQEESDWERIFEMGEDGGCYMGDYIGASPGCLDEIHFNKVNLWGPSTNKKRK